MDSYQISNNETVIIKYNDDLKQVSIRIIIDCDGVTTKILRCAYTNETVPQNIGVNNFYNIMKHVCSQAEGKYRGHYDIKTSDLQLLYGETTITMFVKYERDLKLDFTLELGLCEEIKMVAPSEPIAQTCEGVANATPSNTNVLPDYFGNDLIIGAGKVCVTALSDELFRQIAISNETQHLKTGFQNSDTTVLPTIPPNTIVTPFLNSTVFPVEPKKPMVYFGELISLLNEYFKTNIYSTIFPDDNPNIQKAFDLFLSFKQGFVLNKLKQMFQRMNSDGSVTIDFSVYSHSPHGRKYVLNILKKELEQCVEHKLYRWGDGNDYCMTRLY